MQVGKHAQARKVGDSQSEQAVTLRFSGIECADFGDCLGFFVGDSAGVVGVDVGFQIRAKRFVGYVVKLQHDGFRRCERAYSKVGHRAKDDRQRNHRHYCGDDRDERAFLLG